MDRKIKKYLKNIGLNYGWYEQGVLSAEQVSEMYLEHRTEGHGDHVIPKFYCDLTMKLEGTNTEEFEIRAKKYVSLISSDYSEFMKSYGLCRIAEQNNVTAARYKVLETLLTETGCKKALGFLKKNA